MSEYELGTEKFSAVLDRFSGVIEYVEKLPNPITNKQGNKALTFVVDEIMAIEEDYLAAVEETKQFENHEAQQIYMTALFAGKIKELKEKTSVIVKTSNNITVKQTLAQLVINLKDWHKKHSK